MIAVLANWRAVVGVLAIALAVAAPLESAAQYAGADATFPAGTEADGQPTQSTIIRSRADPARAEVGFTYDDNVTRGRAADEILSDNIYSLFVRMGRTFPIDANAQAVVAGFLNGEAFQKYNGLSHLSGGLAAELQYRGSAEFDAVTFAAFARGWLDQYASKLRDGGRFAFGVGARQSPTDRVDVYGDLLYSVRRAQSAVWDLTDYSARLGLDYSLRRGGTLYFMGEFRRGDTVSDGRATLVNVSIAKVFVLDDAFRGDRLYAYRYDARTWVGTLGYNLSLDTRNSIDFSFRRAQATPTQRPDFETPASLKYFDNQYSFVYLMRF